MKKLSISELESILNQRRGELQKLIAQRAGLLQMVRAVDREMGKLSSGKTGSARGGRRGRRGGGPTLREAIHKALAKSDGPMKVAELAAAVTRLGYVTSSDNLPNIIGQVIYRDEQIEKVARGLFRLKGGKK